MLSDNLNGIIAEGFLSIQRNFPAMGAKALDWGCRDNLVNISYIDTSFDIIFLKDPHIYPVSDCMANLSCH